MADGRNETFHGLRGQLPSRALSRTSHPEHRRLPPEGFTKAGRPRPGTRLYMLFTSTRAHYCSTFSDVAFEKSSSGSQWARRQQCRRLPPRVQESSPTALRNLMSNALCVCALKYK